MARFALINTSNSALIELRDYATQPADPVGKPRKWLPCPAMAQPIFDPAAEKLTGPTYTVGSSSVTEVWATASLTTQEISDAKDNAILSLNGTVFAALAKTLLNHENRIRALESKGAITMTQFKTGVKALL